MKLSTLARLFLLATLTIWLASWCSQRFVVDAAAPAAPASQTVTVRLDGQAQGRIFEGIGGLSAGAASRFLPDYPEPYRSQILDYIFKPYYGASLQHFKVEIGGDTNSTWGSEPSHMHSRDDENYKRGYEWWLMKEARKRNPKIVLDILPWGTPGWIGNHQFYSQDMIDYDLKFINAAHDIHGVDINFVGIWNETRYDREWIKALKRAVVANNASHNLHTQILAADGVNNWQLADDMKADPDLMAAVDVLGVHYPNYTSSSSAQNLKRNGAYVPLSDSEDSYSICPDGVCLGKVSSDIVLAKMLNRNYIEGKMTRMVHCTIAAAYPAFIPFKEGFISATSPWSGHYDVSPSLWAVAHTTQFAQPGWQYLDNATGYIKDEAGKVVGSYVSLKAPNSADYSIIVETSDAVSPQSFNFQLANGLSAGRVHVWHSNMKAGTYFLQEADLAGGLWHTITLQPASIYSLTTTTGQQKGNPGAIPADSPHPYPFSNDFEKDALDQPPNYFVDQEGSFEVVKCAGRSGQCMEQMVDQPPIAWGGGLNTHWPLTFLGDQIDAKRWTDYEVSVDILLQEFGSVTLWGRLDHLMPCSDDTFECLFYQKSPDGYSLNLDSEGRWSLNKSFDKGTAVTGIKSGALTGWPSNTWHRVKMAFRGSTLNVFIDGKAVVSDYQDSGRTHTYGMVAFGTEWNRVQFDNFCLGAACR